jgi:hypothetical protein
MVRRSKSTGLWRAQEEFYRKGAKVAEGREAGTMKGEGLGNESKRGGAERDAEGDFGILNFEFWMLNERSQANDPLGNPSNWPTPFAPVPKLLDEEFSQEGTEETEGLRALLSRRWFWVFW